jgi:hypothetical protein
MTMSKHTPGPLAIRELSDTHEITINSTRGNFNDCGFLLAVMEDTEIECDEVKANSRLIAAAPELLDALRELLAASVPTGEDTRTDRAMAKAKAAIDRATGR